MQICVQVQLYGRWKKGISEQGNENAEQVEIMSNRKRSDGTTPGALGTENTQVSGKEVQVFEEKNCRCLPPSESLLC
jgi:hypothetical protein